MKNESKSLSKIMLLGQSYSGKSTLGNKLVGKQVFNVNLGPCSLTKMESAYGPNGIEIIDTNFGEEETNNLIYNEIIKRKPNIIAVLFKDFYRFDSNISNIKFILEEICKLSNTKSIWDHIIIIFTHSYLFYLREEEEEEKREEFVECFMSSLKEFLNKYYTNHKENDFPLNYNFKYYFVELSEKYYGHGEKEKEFQQETKNNLEAIMKLVKEMPPIIN